MAFRFRKMKPVHKAKSTGANAKTTLDSFISMNAMEPAKILAATQANMGQAISYPEIRQAILNGYLDESYLKQWQKDYSKFVSQTFGQSWIQAMELGGAQAMSDDQNFTIDRTWSGIVNWVKDHGAQFVTNISTVQHEGVNALIAYGVQQGMHPTELARLIRPCVGLTTSQTVSNAKYYNKVKTDLEKNHPKMKPENIERKAKEAALKYAEKQHRYRCQMIAETELSFAYNRGQYEAIKKAQAEGRMGDCVKIWQYAHNDQPCPMCVALEQQTKANGGIGMDEQFEGDYLKTDSKGNSTMVHFQADKGLFPGQGLCPPLHPFCRCTLEYKEVSPPVFAPPPMPQQSAIPQDIPVPPGMTKKGKANLGGTGKMYEYVDQNGKTWLFKPAEDKWGGKAEFRAYIQEAGYKVQSIIDPDTAVPIGVSTLDGEFGAFQQKVEGATNPQLHAWQLSHGSMPSADDLAQIQKEHVTDWLLCNYDSHGRNFVRDANGKLIGVDKEQAFRYINEAGAQAMSYSYHPNAKYNETEPVYNTMYRAFANGTLDLDLRNTLQYIQKIEAIPDAEYREIFRKYAESLHGQGAKAEQLLDQIVDRKQNIRETYRTFFTDLLTQRTGKKQNPFVFADEAGASKANVQTSMMSTAALNAMKKTDLVQLAKQQGLQYYSMMTKAQLIESLRDPVKAQANIQAMKIKAAQKPKKPSQATGQTTPINPSQSSQTGSGGLTGATTGLPPGTIKAEDLFKDLSIIGTDKYGNAVWSDGDKVEGLNLTARRMVIDGVEYYDISGKLRAADWGKLTPKLINSGTISLETTDFGSDWTATKVVQAGMWGSNISWDMLYDKNGDAQLETYTGNQSALEGWFRLRLKASGDGAADAKAARDMLDKYGLGALYANPTARDEETLKLAKLIWQQRPAESDKLRNLSGKPLRDEIDKIIAKTGLDPKRASNMILSREANGYVTYLDPENVREAQANGARYVYTSVPRTDHIVRNIKIGEFSSSMSRVSQGIDNAGGASFSQDVRRGGASGVFTRLVTEKAITNQERFSYASVAFDYQVIFDPAVLNRTDYYSFDDDNFGDTSLISSIGMNPKDISKRLNRSFGNSNELIFRNGIDVKYIKEIRCDTSQQRDDLINALESEGIMELNGIGVRSLVTVGDTM